MVVREYLLLHLRKVTIVSSKGVSSKGVSSKGFSFPGNSRLKKKRDFAEVQRKGARFSSRHFLVLVSPPATGLTRLGLVVTKKLEKRAVARNTIKRRVREAFRQLRSSFEINKDIVVIARRGSLQLSAKEVKAELAQIWMKARLLPTRDDDA